MRAKNTANGLVFITDRRHLAHALYAIEDYLKLTETKETIIDLLAMHGAVDIDFEVPKLSKKCIGLRNLIIYLLLDTNVVYELIKGNKAAIQLCALYQNYNPHTDF
ncbi:MULTISPECIES: hypothetical protein [unclassified Legionella]